MNLIQALAQTRTNTDRLSQKALSPSQVLGGIPVPEGNVSPAPVSKIRPEVAVRDGFKSNVFAYSCVKRLASASSQAEWKVYRRTGSGEKDWEPDPSDWRAKKLAYPNEKIAAQELFYYLSGWLAIDGNGLLRIVPGGSNGIAELWPMSPVNVDPVPDPVEWVRGYNIVEDGKIRFRYPAAEIIHTRLPDPSNPLWGFGMLSAAWPSVQADRASQTWRKTLYESGGVPPAAITDSNLSASADIDEQTAALHRAWRRNSKDHVPMLLGAGTNVLQFGFSAQDLQIPEDRNLTRDEIVTAFGMHPAMFSSIAATFDNMRTAIRYMYDNGVAELLGLIRSALNLALLTPDERESDDVWISYDLSDVPFFRQERAANIETMGKAIRSGISRNDAASMLDMGLENVDGGDEAFIESGLVLLREAGDGISGEDATASRPLPPNMQPPTDTPDEPMPTDKPGPDGTPPTL